MDLWLTRRPADSISCDEEEEAEVEAEAEEEEEAEAEEEEEEEEEEGWKVCLSSPGSSSSRVVR